jgi:MFS transporter, DHA3 family, multidrug efflux protein
MTTEAISPREWAAGGVDNKPQTVMATFRALLVNSLAASVTNNFVWFAVTFWVYLQTRSVMATSVMAGIYLGTVAVSGFFLGSLVDRHSKKLAMLWSSIGSLVLYGLAAAVYVNTPAQTFNKPGSLALWAFIILTLVGAIAGNLRSIALSTLVTVLIPEDHRDRANGMVGTATGTAYLVASFLSGFVIGRLGMLWMLGIAVAATALAILHLLPIRIPEPERSTEEQHRVDIRGTIRVVRLVPGLTGLILFSTFNNFLGGVFIALMDAYGLQLISVEAWGTLWGFLTLGFIVGGLVVARRGLGKEPLRALFLCNVAMWIISILFPLRSSILLLGVGMFVYLCLIPAVEAAEQTIIQKVIPPERQGRVFGFAQSVEQAVSPLTAFLIGPIAQYLVIPFMTTGSGAELIGGWFGTGPARGLALVFVLAGVVGLVVTVLAMRSRSTRQLSAAYRAL